MAILDRNFGIGAAVGAAAVLAIALVIFSATLSMGSKNGTMLPPDNTNLYIHGLVKDVSRDTLTLDQSFNRTSTAVSEDNTVTISLQGAALFDCRFSPNASCVGIEYDQLAKGIHACAHVYTSGGKFIGGKIFTNAVCSLERPPQA